MLKTIRRIIQRTVQHGLPARAVLCLLPAMVTLSTQAATTPANTQITNTAVASFSKSGISYSTAGSTSFITEEINPASVAPTPSEITLLHLAGTSASGLTVNASECMDSSGNYSSVTSVSGLTGTTYSVPSSYSTSAAGYGFKIGEPVLIQLEDLDKNLNPAREEQIEITLVSGDGADAEQLRLTESGINTGIFTGVIDTASKTDGLVQYDCVLSLSRAADVIASYSDSNDATDKSTGSAVFDPYSRVINALTGDPVNGVKVTLIDATTGAAASVYDDDGVTPFSATVTTGPDSSSGTLSILATDDDMPDGAFRFPYIPDGEYQLAFEAPDEYRVPSAKTTDEVASNLGDSYAITDASYGSPFTVSNNVFYSDIPADDLDSGLLLSKSANKTDVGVGDFIQYTITLSNADTAISDGNIIDKMPVGLRYRSGSVRYDDEKTDEPAITADGRTLTFSLPDIAADETLTITYVTQVTALAQDRLTNVAWLDDDAVSSNKAEASVQVTDEFFSDTARLFGRVYLDDCDGNLDAEAVPDIRLFMEDGTYVVTDKNGEWHIEDVRPGTHVVQLDTSTIPPYMEVMTCDHRGFHAGRSFSQFVDVQGGSFWRVDFALKMKEPETGEVSQRLTNKLVPLQPLADGSLPYHSPVEEKIRYTLQLNGNGVALNDIMQMIALPEGVVYEPGSSVMDGEPWPDPRVSYGTLIYKLGDKPAEWSHELTFTAVISDQADSGNLTARAITRFRTDGQGMQQIKPASTTAILQLPPDDGQIRPINPPKFANFSDELTAEDKANLKQVIDRLHGLRNLTVEVVGHTDSTPIARRNRHIYADNQQLSEARASSVAHYLAEQLGVKPSHILSSGRGESTPIATNMTAAGRAQNRRVEVKVLSGDPDIRLASTDTDIQVAEVQASVEGFLSQLPATAAGMPEDNNAPEMPEFSENWFNTAADDAQWLWPPVDRSPAIASTKIAISHSKDEHIRLLLNNEPVSPLNFDGTSKSKNRDLAVSTWRGVDLQPGANHFSVFVINKDGDIVSQFERNVQFAQVPAKAELVADKTHAIADGMNPAVIAVRLTDKDGFPIRYGVTGTVTIASPYELYDERKQIEANPLGDVNQPQYRVGNDGIALIYLTPTTKAGEARLTFAHNNGQEDEVKVWLKPQPRDWILVGLGDLSVGYNSASGNRDSMDAADVSDNIYEEGRLAFFTQGQVSGEWLITAAYDSGKPEAEAFASLIEPDRYYTLYGDASQQQLDASSARKLYVRVERERFYAMFGDINTGLSDTVLSQYNRKMTGAQAHYQGDIVELSGFISQSDNGSVRDEIQGDGTSGLYHLSAGNIVLNSETITIEVRDRYRSEVVVSSETLSRDSDYVIDYDDGTIYFKSPVSATDDSFNPRYIIAEYEVEDAELGYVSGGRAGVNLFDERLKAGVTAITQNQNGEDVHLRGADVTVKMGDTQIKAEVAQSEEVSNGSASGANAHLVEITHRTQTLEAKAYVRSQDENFGFEQSPQSENDFRKEGLEGSLYISDRDRLEVEGFHHYEISTGYDTYQAQTQWVHRLDDQQQVSLGLLTAQEENDSDNLYSDQLTAGYKVRVLDNRMTLSLSGQSNISSRSDDDDLLGVGAEYRLTENLSLYTEHETGFSSAATQRTTIGARATPWSGAQVQQSLEQLEEDDAYRLYAVSGLNQDIPLSSQWSMSFGFDQAKNLEANVPGESSDSTEDYYALYTGAAFRTELWQWNGRLEKRDGDETDKWVARTSLYHPLSDALATGASVEYFTEAQQGDNSYSNSLDASFDLALRPRKYPVALLWQTRWVQEASGSDDDTPERTRKLINNVHGNWLFTPANQLAAQYGIKRVLDQYDSEDYASTTDFMAAEWRHHLNPTWDIGAHGRRLHSYEAGQTQHGLGMSVGWIPQTNVWLGLGYNFTGFVDTDFSASNFTAKGVYLKMRFKADQETLATLRNAFN